MYICTYTYIYVYLYIYIYVYIRSDFQEMCVCVCVCVCACVFPSHLQSHSLHQCKNYINSTKSQNSAHHTFYYIK